MKKTRYSQQHILAAFFTLLSVYAVVLSSAVSSEVEHLSKTSQWSARLSSPYHTMRVVPSFDTIQDRIAYRLQQRLRKNGWGTPRHSIVSKAISQRQFLLKSATSVHFSVEEGSDLAEWNVSLQQYPLWIQPHFSLTKAQYTLDEERIADDLTKQEFPDIIPPEDILLSAVSTTGAVLRAQTNSIAKDGITLDVEKSAVTIAKALQLQESDVVIPLAKRPGIIANMSEYNLGNLELLASGKSNFAGSTYSRSKNVQKALREHVHNVLVPPGETFSFNSTLNGPVDLRNGWSMAKIIINGEDLVYAPGGGICQASTTVYRAIVNAGFPVVERRSHSLYVSYYKKYGVGIDATIYPGSQDLVFLNDTENYLLIQAYDDENKDAVVNFYGTDDGREVALEGPYFHTSAPEDLEYNGRSLYRNEIAWVQRVTYPNGETRFNTIVSRYKALPVALRQEYVYEL